VNGAFGTFLPVAKINLSLHRPENLLNLTWYEVFWQVKMRISVGKANSKAVTLTVTVIIPTSKDQ
jgi:hypothetical protein